MTYFAVEDLEYPSSEEVITVTLDISENVYNDTVVITENLLGTYYFDIESGGFPPEFIISNNLPTFYQLSKYYKQYANNIAVLCLYLTNEMARDNITKVYSIINTDDPVPNNKLRTKYKRIESQLLFFTDPGKADINAHLPIIYIQNVIKYNDIFQKIGIKKEIFAP